MCEACSTKPAAAGRSHRLRIWELDPMWHCTVVGTCLTLGDLRTLVRKLRYRVDLGTVSDYELHSHFVGKASKSEPAGKLLNKLLDRKYAAAIRKFSQAKTPEALQRLWEDAFAAGDIPGPLWAASSHPALTIDLGTLIYGNVHMLSHLVGAANRADIRAVHGLEQDNAALMVKLEREKRRSQKRAEEHQHLVAELYAEGARAARAEERAASLEAQLAIRDGGRDGTSGKQPRNREADSEVVVALRAELAQQSSALDDLALQLDAAKQRETALRTECAALEGLLGSEPSHTAIEASGAAGCPFDLDGRCILYVGGRATNVCHLRTLVQQWNGEFLHHDGGLEKSIDELASVVSRADAVVFPTDCVSHQAVKKLKQLCRRNMKPVVPLRSAGLSSFVAGLQRGLDTTQRLEPGP